MSDASVEICPPILTLPPEIFPLVASYLPLQLLPATLSALVLTTSHVNAYVKPILYSKVIIKNEDHVYQVLDRISKDRQLGSWIRELHILTDLSVETIEERNGTTVLIKLHEVIRAGFIPHMEHLRLVLLEGWNHDIQTDEPSDYHHLPRRFWTDLRENCPRLRRLFLDGVGDSTDDPWMYESGLYELKDLTHLSTLSIKFRCGSPRAECPRKLFKSLANLTSTLQSLTVFLGHLFEDIGIILSNTFPHLKSFNVSCVVLQKTENAMDFWARHPGLERVNFHTCVGHRWFSDGVKSGLLPRLTHLRARYDDVKALASHLGQLHHLSINYSLNCQIPYLLRSVIPEGLPDLKSLEIHQVPSSEREIHSAEGAMWYEKKDGKFLQQTCRGNASKTMDSYMHSIARGAPNVQELCLQGYPLKFDDLKRMAPALAQFKRLERFYFRAFGSLQKTIEKTDIDRFISKCHLVANSCNSLGSVTDISFTDFGPYHMGKVVRNPGGSVVEVVPGRGFGMEFTGGNDDPFPNNPRPSS